MPEPLYGESFIPGWPEQLAVPYGGPYRAKVVQVHDGDTVTLEVSLGFNVRVEVQIRLYGINAPELNTPEGKAAAEFLQLLAVQRTPVRLTTLLATSGEQTQSFTRYVGSIEVVDHLQVFDLAETMVNTGHAYYCDRNLKPLDRPPPPISRWVPPSK